MYSVYFESSSAYENKHHLHHHSFFNNKISFELTYFFYIPVPNLERCEPKTSAYELVRHFQAHRWSLGNRAGIPPSRYRRGCPCETWLLRLTLLWALKRLLLFCRNFPARCWRFFWNYRLTSKGREALTQICCQKCFEKQTKTFWTSAGQPQDGASSSCAGKKFVGQPLCTTFFWVLHLNVFC